MAKNHPKVEYTSSGESSEEGESMHDNGSENMDKSTSAKEDFFSPSEMKSMLEEFFDGIKQANCTLKTRKYKAIKSYAEKCFKNVDEYTLDKFAKSYAFYMKKFNNKPSFEVDEHAFEFMLNNNTEILHLYDDYPKRTANKAHVYAKLNKIPIVIKAMPTIMQKMKNDIPGAAAAEAELGILEKDELEHLEIFKNRHEDELGQPLLDTVESRIRSLRKKVFGEIIERKRKAVDNSNSSKAKKSKKEPISVFDFFVRSLEGKYDHLKAEKRERKLKKKFNQLPPEQLKIYEDCFKTSC